MSRQFRCPLLGLLVAALPVLAEESPQTRPTTQPELAPLIIKLPAPAYGFGPRHIPRDPDLEKLPTRPRPPILVPRGTVNLALNRPVSSSDKEPVIGTLDKITDGVNSYKDEDFVELQAGPQWVQIDLGESYPLSAVLVWHSFSTLFIFRGVVVQVSNDPAFKEDVRTLFNNDQKNEVGQGAGKDLRYFETYEGKLIEAKGVRARYVRLYGLGEGERGSAYTEVEVYGQKTR